MLRRAITYTDLNGEEQTDTFYFNLTAVEIIDLQLSFQGGLEAGIQKIVEANDQKSLFDEFKKIVLGAVGIKSDDGKRFIKSEEISNQFKDHAAFPVLVLELMSSADVAAEFVTGILPKNLQAQLNALQAQPNNEAKAEEHPSTAAIKSI